MVYTLTLNPSLDHIIRIKDLEIGETNRSDEEEFYPGGKGINVSRILNELDVSNISVGYIAGFTGREIERLVHLNKVKTDFIHLDEGINRINVKIKSRLETEINSNGPIIDEKSKKLLLEKLNILKDGDFLVLAGSIPPCLKNSFYSEIMEMLIGKNINIVVDATGESLLNTLKYKPLLIKPNKRELEEITNLEFKEIDDIRKNAFKLKSLGARNIIVSLGKDGAILIEENGDVIYKEAPKGQVKNTVGSGDSMVGGFIAALVKGYDTKKAFDLAIACGSATAFCDDLAKKEDINKLFYKITKEKN